MSRILDTDQYNILVISYEGIFKALASDGESTRVLI
jgi:hypothetical protein